MQAQYGPNPKKLREIVSEVYSQYGLRRGIMRGYWVRAVLVESTTLSRLSLSQITVVREIPAYGGALNNW